MARWIVGVMVEGTVRRMLCAEELMRRRDEMLVEVEVQV